MPSVLGPMSNSLFGVKAFMKAVIDAKPWRKDPLVLRKPWDQASYELVEHGNGRGLVFGIIWHDGNVLPHPPIIRALEIVKSALTAAGHRGKSIHPTYILHCLHVPFFMEVINWEPYKHLELCNVASGIWRAGQTEDFAAAILPTGEPLIQTMDLNQSATPSNSKGSLLGVSAYALWQLQKHRRALREEYLNRWEATATKTGTGRPVDAIISPVGAYTAAPHGKNLSATYTMVYNALDYPALAFPVTKVDPVLDGPKPAHKFLSSKDKANYDLCESISPSVYSWCDSDYPFVDTPDTFKDAPVGLQLVGRTHEEEAVIGMCEVVDEAIRKTPKAKL